MTLTEAESHLRDLIARVREGERVLITDDGVPIAELVPAPARLTPEEEESRLARLEERGVIRRGTWNGPDPRILAPFPDPSGPSGVLDALLEERREGR